jgi:ubiquinone/menaquinone biosynthesis C-methylase UbiE
MTDEMLALARKNAKEAGAGNVEFLKGEIENIPLPDQSIDVIISNCVINLSPDKDAVLSEAFRVLKPGGRFAVADIVVRGKLPEAVRKHLEVWAGCVAGALEETEYQQKLTAAGFEKIEKETVRTYAKDDAREFFPAEVLAELDAAQTEEVSGMIISAFVRAQKPASCCKCCGR